MTSYSSNVFSDPFFTFFLFFMLTDLILKVASFKVEKLDVLYVYLWTIIISIKILYKNFLFEFKTEQDVHFVNVIHIKITHISCGIIFAHSKLNKV